ncbi:cytochrome c biogenesis CcdA family protein [Lichenibacterium dinghuense]|uniref:cytochrome c biogenesis CcdA family protein n=1 Tax=Lichenibacterium dinghuense TaxID=2895977 RepID=UPI001F4828FA|nr:cytochrome c biogenesis protein CcdA [Lichenibacterium sp. 6Y81]
MSTGLALLAGILSVLSPCVLPILPVVLGAAAARSRLGPAALAGGLALSFTAIGLFFATIGFALGLDAGGLRRAAAVVLILLGLVLVLPRLQARLAAAAGPVGQWADARFGGFSRDGLAGQFALGLLLGAVWSPCVGPTLGAASALAAEGRDLGQVALTMLAFGLGAALPLLLFGAVSRGALMRWRGRMLAAGAGLKAALGVLLVVAGLLIVTGLDRRAEAALVDASPAWLTDATTRF